jgi:hypothetical protein
MMAGSIIERHQEHNLILCAAGYLSVHAALHAVLATLVLFFDLIEERHGVDGSTRFPSTSIGTYLYLAQASLRDGFCTCHFPIHELAKPVVHTMLCAGQYRARRRLMRPGRGAVLPRAFQVLSVYR